jgi:hypothetical protein
MINSKIANLLIKGSKKNSQMSVNPQIAQGHEANEILS